MGVLHGMKIDGDASNCEKKSFYSRFQQIVGQTAADMVTLVMRSVMVAGMEVTEMTGAETTMVVEATGETTTIVVVMGATGDTEEEVLEEWQVVVENTVIVTEEKNQFKALHHLVWPNEMLVDLS